MSDEPMGDPPIPTAFEPEDTGRWLQDADPPADRMDLLVGPQDKKWKLRHRYFTHLLETDIPIKDIIRESFTHHQYRLLAPAERADVKEIQEDNIKRYEALLARRFKGVEDSLATKLFLPGWWDMMKRRSPDTMSSHHCIFSRRMTIATGERTA
jgi:hypothetical protein